MTTKLKGTGRVSEYTRPQDESEESDTPRRLGKGRRGPGNQARDESPATGRTTSNHCTWTREKDRAYHWITHCGHEFVLLHFLPNECGFIFCPYCGAIIDFNEVKNV